MPIVTIPFEYIGIDIAPPPTTTSQRHKYLLVVIDFATYYPEAMFLHNMHAEMVANKLATLFSRVGFPKQVVTNQGDVRWPS